jgi:phospholipid/cholesterol/gamma-HCH transport system substrate-binding protein
MDKSRLEWKVGLFVLIGLVLLAVLLMQFSKGNSFFRPTYGLLLHSDNVAGLKKRAQVLMSGVQVGAVTDMALGSQGTNVTISLRIYNQYQIHKDVRFVIESSGFLGDQYIAVIPTRNEDGCFADGDEATCEAPINIQEVTRSADNALKRVDITISQLNDVIANVRRLTLNNRVLTNLSETVANARVISEHALAALDNINAVVESNGAPIGASVSNLMLFSGRINRIADGVNDVVETNSPEIRAAVRNLEAATATLKILLDDVHAGKGSAGKLLRDEQIAANLTLITSNLSVTTSNLNRLGLWSILWKHKAARANEPAGAASALKPPKNPED